MVSAGRALLGISRGPRGSGLQSGSRAVRKVASEWSSSARTSTRSGASDDADAGGPSDPQGRWTRKRSAQLAPIFRRSTPGLERPLRHTKSRTTRSRLGVTRANLWSISSESPVHLTPQLIPSTRRASWIRQSKRAARKSARARARASAVLCASPAPSMPLRIHACVRCSFSSPRR